MRELFWYSGHLTGQQFLHALYAIVATTAATIAYNARIVLVFRTPHRAAIPSRSISGHDPKSCVHAAESCRVCRFACTRRFVLDDVAGDGAGRHRQRTGQVHLPRTAAPGKVSVLRADHHLVGTRGDTRSGIDAGPAARLNHLRAGSAEDVEVALAHAVFARLLRSELEIELAIFCNPLALP